MCVNACIVLVKECPNAALVSILEVVRFGLTLLLFCCLLSLMRRVIAPRSAIYLVQSGTSIIQQYVQTMCVLNCTWAGSILTRGRFDLEATRVLYNRLHRRPRAEVSLNDQAIRDDKWLLLFVC